MIYLDGYWVLNDMSLVDCDLVVNCWLYESFTIDDKSMNLQLEWWLQLIIPVVD